MKQEKLRIKEWEKKFDEEQKIKEEALIKNFYEDKIENNKLIEIILSFHLYQNLHN